MLSNKISDITKNDLLLTEYFYLSLSTNRLNKQY